MEKPSVYLFRSKSTEQGTLGVLVAEGECFYSLELPNLDNKPQVSCIPSGEYDVKWTKSPRLHKFTYEILSVPNRGGIRIHGGNYAGSKPVYRSDSLGCPLLGSNIATMNKQVAITGSRLAVRKFEQLMNGRAFTLKIVDYKEGD